MKLSRPTRLIAACLALIGLLFMQLAVASYVCPGSDRGDGIHVSASMPDSMSQSMPGCEGMDTQQPGLCHAHAHPHDQSLDTPQLPIIGSFVAAGIALILIQPDAASSPATLTASSIFLKRTTAPPIAIRHCCFRI